MGTDMTQERAYDWNERIEKPEEGGEFVLLPEGVYPFSVTKMEKARHNGSENLPACNKAVVTLRVGNDETGYTTVKHNLFLHSKCQGLLCQFFTGIGARRHGEALQMNWDRVVRAQGRCKLGIRKGTGNYADKQYNEVKQILDPGESATATPATASNADDDGFDWDAGR